MQTDTRVWGHAHMCQKQDIWGHAHMCEIKYLLFFYFFLIGKKWLDLWDIEVLYKVLTI